jgi:hypothetical protein
MSIVMLGSTSGSCTLQEQAVAGTTVLTLPAVSGTVLTTTSPKAGNVLQVVQTVKTDTFSTSSSSYTDVTGLSVSITPTSATSKILVLYSSTIGAPSGQYSAGLQLVRGSTAIYLGDVRGVRTRASSWMWSEASQYAMVPVNGIFLDSPATTSATTYKLQMISPYAVQVELNRNQIDGNNAVQGSIPSQITVMEIAA